MVKSIVNLIQPSAEKHKNQHKQNLTADSADFYLLNISKILKKGHFQYIVRFIE